MKRLGIAISTYNNIDAVATNINVIRKYWKNKDVFISVCCNNSPNFNRVKSLDIDCFTAGIDYKPEDFTCGPKAWRRMRQYDTIKKAVMGCIDSVDYVAQWHADAYALDDDILYSMLDKMEKNNYKVAFRGLWQGDCPTPGVLHPKRPYGHIDDHFVIFESHHLKNSGLYNDYPQISEISKVANELSSEGILSYIIQKVTKPDQLWHYDDMSQNEVSVERHKLHYFFKDGINHGAINPFNFDPNRKFLHCNNMEQTRQFFERCSIPLDLLCIDQEETNKGEDNQLPDYLGEWLNE